FKLERYFAQYEFTTGHLLCASDVQGYRLPELLALADEEGRRLWDELPLGYTESSGHPLLRQAIAGLYEHVEAEDILVCSGAEEAVFLTLQALLGPTDHAIVTWPAYQSLRDVARVTGATVDLLPLNPSEGWLPDVAALEQLVRPNTRLIVVNLPHNPTGMLPGLSRFEQIVQVAERAGAYLLSDEVYRCLEYDPVDRLPAGVDAALSGISLGVMSKAFGLAGLRIGWVACRDREVVRRIASLKDYTTICSSAPSEVLALIALRAREQVLARGLGIIRENLQALDPFFRRWSSQLEWVRPAAGAVGFPRFLGSTDIGWLAARLREEAGVLILPGEVFDFPGAHFRLGFGRTDFSNGLDRLDRALTSILGAP
ncbi:MAG: aminotransferase class I/II-fold pyridoxal phosphate-dependent enzyme, partial [Gemmatimonadales bacterium]|nr:aminotransferase class I/II-fold pyridoxal phosphate-dependent enzyme [Gemmatimonadales bacterium]